MTRHPNREILSAYLDGQLDVPEVRRIEDHLELCPPCRDTYEGLRSVVFALKGLERMAPPSTLDFQVTRRIALDDGMPGLLERLENQLDRLPRLQSPLLGHFAIILALASMLYLFADALDRHARSGIPVIFDPPRTESPQIEPLAPPPQLLPIDGVRYEPGIEPTTTIDERIVTGGSRWEEVLRIRPELDGLTEDSQPAIVHVGTRIVAIHPAAS